jgi:hypothetical protein
VKRVIEQSQEYIRGARSVPQLRSRLLGVAAQWAPGLLGSGTDPRFWRAYDLRVVRRDLGALRGLLRPSRSGQRIAVSISDHPRVQRFTVAHELAHVLIEDIDRSAIGLDTPLEERLCDQFASHLLIPRDDLEVQLADFTGEPQALLALIRRYDVSLSALLAAVAEQFHHHQLLAFAVSERGHKNRPQEICHRIHRVHCRPFFLPEERRVVSLGLESLERHLRLRPAYARGRDSNIEMPLWQPGSDRRSGIAVGEVDWELAVLPNGIGLVCMRTAKLHCRWATARQPVAA